MRGGADDWDGDVDVVALPDAVVVYVVVEVEAEDGVVSKINLSFRYTEPGWE